MQTTQMENSLQLCIIHLFCFVLLANASEFGVEPDDGCNEARCGDDGPTIQFPFWLKGQQPEHCGYPGFELSCTEHNRTMLKLPHSGKLYVEDIDYYRGQRINLYDPDGCNDPRLVPNLTSSPFAFDDYMTYYTLFNCSTYKDSSQDGVMLIPCLSSTHHYQIVALMSVENAISVPQSCQKMYDLEPLPVNVYYNNRKYISLQWNNPMCGSCYVNGHKCTRMENTSKTRCLVHKRGIYYLISKHKTSIYYLISSIYFSVDPLELSLNLCERGICLILKGIISQARFHQPWLTIL